MDFKQSIARHPHDFLYLDPPYYNPQKLYGTSDNNSCFNHIALAQLLIERIGYSHITIVRASEHCTRDLKLFHFSGSME